METTANMIAVPLTKLVLWHGNVRKTGAETGLDELAASIAAHGLLNPLTVCRTAKGKYAVVAGQRRYLALKLLTKTGRLPKGAPVACHLADDAQDPAELSLAENVVRIAMHPADQFEAWRDLTDKGATPGDIAARFGVAESTVRKRMALARVSPRIFDHYRQGDLDLEALQAFTITDDHALQDSVWEGLSGWQREDARAIRRALAQSDIPTHDKRVRFVGLEAYEAAGGAVRRDLFDPEGGGYVLDAALLDAMTLTRLETVASEVKAEGWHWTETRIEFPWDEQRAFGNARPVQVPLTAALQDEADRLGDELNDLQDEQDGDERGTAIEARLAEIEAAQSVWTDEVKAKAGAIVFVALGGVAGIERGLIRPEDAGTDEPEDERQDSGAAGAVMKPPALPASLVEELTAQKTAALRIELARAPETALALIVHSMATAAFYRHGDDVLKASLTTRSLRTAIQDHDQCRAVLALNDEADRIRDILPGDHAALWGWCLTAGREALLDVLAVAVAHGIDAVEGRSDPNAGGRRHGDALASALKLDMASWYRPTATGYFGRTGKAMILSDLEAARAMPCAPAWAKLKKAELAALAEREMAGTGWLPAPLR
jgi:ParB family chromosome partitioning protein